MIDYVTRHGHIVIYAHKERPMQSSMLTKDDSHIHLVVRSYLLRRISKSWAGVLGGIHPSDVSKTRFFGEKQVTGPFLNQLHPDELITLNIHTLSQKKEENWKFK